MSELDDILGETRFPATVACHEHGRLGVVEIPLVDGDDRRRRAQLLERADTIEPATRRPHPYRHVAFDVDTVADLRPRRCGTCPTTYVTLPLYQWFAGHDRQAWQDLAEAADDAYASGRFGGLDLPAPFTADGVSVRVDADADHRAPLAAWILTAEPPRWDAVHIWTNDPHREAATMRLLVAEHGMRAYTAMHALLMSDPELTVADVDARVRHALRH